MTLENWFLFELNNLVKMLTQNDILDSEEFLSCHTPLTSVS